MLWKWFGATRRTDEHVAEMLYVTFASYKATFDRMGRDFLVGTIKQYPGITVMSDRVPEEFIFRFPNELSPFVVAANFTRDPFTFTAVGEPPYAGFMVVLGLKGGGRLMTSAGQRSGRATPRGKYLSKWFINKGALLIP
jgi:hypothetical protein